jgi:hypothetical protein
VASTGGEARGVRSRAMVIPLNESYGLGSAADNVRAAVDVDEAVAEARFVERLRGLVESRA